MARKQPERSQKNQQQHARPLQDQEEEKYLYPDPKDPDTKPPLPEGS